MRMAATNISRISGMLSDHDEHLSVQRASVTAVAREAARSLRGIAESRGVEIRVSDDLPEIVIDVGQLELLLVNLLSNAVKYADLAKPTRIVDVTSAPSDDSHCVIQVRDNGIGMDTDRLAHVFTPFIAPTLARRRTRRRRAWSRSCDRARLCTRSGRRSHRRERAECRNDLHPEAAAGVCSWVAALGLETASRTASSLAGIIVSAGFQASPLWWTLLTRAARLATICARYRNSHQFWP